MIIYYRIRYNSYYFCLLLSSGFFFRSIYKPGSITFYGMNLKEEHTTVIFPQFIQGVVLHVYMLQPVGKDSLKSK